MYSSLTEGLGNDNSFHSLSHGAGRPFSRTEAKKRHNADEFEAHMGHRDILHYGLATDETPFAYKDIEEVIGLQEGVLLNRVARLEPKVVVMGGKSDDGD